MAKKPPLTFQKTRTGLTPFDSETAAQFDGFPLGTEFRATPLTSRSNRQLGLYFSVLREVCDATGKWATSAHLHDAIKLDLGFRTVVERLDGKKYWIPDSVAFDAMDQQDFNAYCDAALARLSEVVGYDVLQSYQEMRGAA